MSHAAELNLLSIDEQAKSCAQDAVALAEEVSVYLVEDAKKPTAKEPSEFERMVAARFAKARQINGLTENDAILRMGIKNRTVLSQLENAHRFPTSKMLIRAANAYGVSADYLLGMSEDEDRSSDIAARAAIYRRIDSQVSVFNKALTGAVFDYAKTVGDDKVKNMVSLVSELATKFDRFCELNPAFEDMRGGSSLQELIASLKPVTRQIKNDITRRDKIIELHNKQLDTLIQRQLFGEVNG